jgi:hypothetical protein
MTSGMLRHEVCLKSIDVSEVHPDEGSKYIWNVCQFLPDCTARTLQKTAIFMSCGCDCADDSQFHTRDSPPTHFRAHNAWRKQSWPANR